MLNQTQQNIEMRKVGGRSSSERLCNVLFTYTVNFPTTDFSPLYEALVRSHATTMMLWMEITVFCSVYNYYWMICWPQLHCEVKMKFAPLLTNCKDFSCTLMLSPCKHCDFSTSLVNEPRKICKMNDSSIKLSYMMCLLLICKWHHADTLVNMLNVLYKHHEVSSACQHLAEIICQINVSKTTMNNIWQGKLIRVNL